MFTDRFIRDGCLVIPRLFEPALIDAVREETERQYGEIDLDRPPEHFEVGHRRLQLPLSLKGPLLDPDLYAHPLLSPMLKTLLGNSLVIDNVSFVIAFPGAEEQHLHRDHPDLFADRLDTPPFAITVAIPLIDLTEETGTTRLYPGSIDAPRGSDGMPVSLPDPEDPLIARGGCMLVDYRLWHRGMANRSNRARPVLYITYSRDWFTDAVNYRQHAALEIDPGEYEKIAPEHRPLFRRAAGRGLPDSMVDDSPRSRSGDRGV